MLHELWKQEDGVVLVIASLIIVSLFAAVALTIDVGQIYLTRSRLQAAADSAALAGARQLVMSGDIAQTRQICATYVQKNLGDTVEPTIDTDQETNTVSVALNQDVQFYFAPLIGVENTRVDATATASASVVVKMNNVVPLGVVKQDFQYGEQYVMKYGACSDGDGGSYHGNFFCIDYIHFRCFDHLWGAVLFHRPIYNHRSG